MSNPPASWEDAAGDDESLAQQTQDQLNIQQQQQRQGQQQPFRPSFNAPSFNPGASSFNPGAGTFQPGGYGQQGYGGYNQYGGGQYGQYYQQPQQGYDQYGQYGQGYQQQQQFGAYNQAPGQYNNYQTQQAQPQQQSFQQYQAQKAANKPAAPVIAQKPAASATAAPSAPKTLNISGNSTPMVLSIGGSKPAEKKAPAAEKKETNPKPSTKTEAGNKVAAAKAVEKTDKGAASTKSSPAPSGKSSPAPAAAAATAAATAKENAAAAAKRDADAVLKEQEEEVDETVLGELYGKEHVNLIFIGHVDAGKSSLGGSILFETGMVDERTMEKYKREAKEQGRESWYLSWALDLTKEERSKGKTVEVGRAYFETEKRRYTVLDAPGHKNFVPNMIGGASQADVGVLVISARKGEYETGFEKGGQTREHAVLAKTQGVNKLVVVVNKMDDPTVEWSQARYKECTEKLANFLKATGYNPKTDLMFMPLSALTGEGLKRRVDKKLCPWYDGPSLLEYLDNMQGLERKLKAPFMMPIGGKYRDMGTVIEGKIESGIVRKGDQVLMMPGKTPIEIVTIYSETEEEINVATCGDQIRVRVRGVEEEDVVNGFVLCSTKRPIHCVSAFEAQIHIIDLKSILSAGFNCVMHVHATSLEVTFAALLHKLEKGTGRKSKKPPAFASKGQAIIARLESVAGSTFPIERYEDHQQLGRFTLRDQGQTIAIGKVTKLIFDSNTTA